MARGKWRDSSEFSDDEDVAAFPSENEARRRLNAYKIKRLKHNHPGSREVSFGREYFSEKAWGRLGDYVARNDHLECLSIRRCNLTDENMCSFFRGAAASGKARTKVLTLYANSFGSGGARSLVPFLRSAGSLTSLNVSGNNIGTEGFWWLMKGLDGGPIEKLNLRHCGLESVVVLERCSLPRLQVLYLSDNGGVRVVGCRTISELLRQRGCNLKKLYVNRCQIGDLGAEMIAESLAQNKSLTHLELESNGILERGHLALLKVINDVSSCEKTFTSNHILRLIDLKGNAVTTYTPHIRDAVEMNRSHNGDTTGVGRAKVIKYQLNSDTRALISGLEGVGDYFMKPFVDLDAAILPDVIALVGLSSGLSDLYRLMVARNGDLGFSIYGNENRTLKKKIFELNATVAEQKRQIAALTVRNLELRTRLASINHFASKIQSNIGHDAADQNEDTKSNKKGKKRLRSDDV